MATTTTTATWVSEKKDGDGKQPHILVTGSLG
jgi:hypothetical protein